MARSPRRGVHVFRRCDTPIGTPATLFRMKRNKRGPVWPRLPDNLAGRLRPAPSVTSGCPASVWRLRVMPASDAEDGAAAMVVVERFRSQPAQRGGVSEVCGCDETLSQARWSNITEFTSEDRASTPRREHCVHAPHQRTDRPRRTSIQDFHAECETCCTEQFRDLFASTLDRVGGRRRHGRQ
jgi:hypothetical protein